MAGVSGDPLIPCVADVATQDGGGDEGTRTPDPCDANAVLFQLSYIPTEGRASPVDGGPVANGSTRSRVGR